MVLPSISRCMVVVVLCCVMACGIAVGQNFIASTSPLHPSAALETIPARVSTPSPEYQPKYLGTYRADGKFRAVSTSAYVTQMLDDLDANEEDVMQRDVPLSIKLHSNERAVENFEPPARASHPVQGHSLLSTLRDNIITFAYGHEKVLRNPTHVTTDSKQRVIISDPGLAAVHVLDPAGKNSFRISGGPQQRLRSPNGIAVDGEDNIYVADGEIGLVSVYDPAGQFLRYIGSVRGESMFDSPTGLAIDRKAGKLYVLDSTADELIVLDLKGNVLKRVGGVRARTNVKLKHPTEISLRNDEVVVLDRYGSRVQVFDLNCVPLNSFDVRSENGPPIFGEIGLALDSSSNIYISNLLSSTVRIYRHDGQFVGFLGPQKAARNFSSPDGLWVDSSDRLFVSSSANGRIQVFQIQEIDSLIAGASR